MEGLISNKDDSSSIGKQQIEKLVVFSIMWSVGALLEISDRVKMEEFMKQTCNRYLPIVDEGSGDTIFEYTVDSEGNKKHIV